MIVPTYETTAREQEMIINELRSINRTQENRINIQKEEIKRLNNIINELEEGLRSCYDFDNGVISKDYLECVDDTLDKLKELKGEE